MNRFERLGAIALAGAAAVVATTVAAQDAAVPTAPTTTNAAADTATAAQTSKEELAAQRAAAKEQERKARELKRLYGEGPYPGEQDAFLANKPEQLKPLLATLYAGGERNAVLNLDRVGLAAMELGEWALAEHAFDLALNRIEAVYAKSKQAEQAKSSFKKEARKDFKGEPYERAMTFYYRGLLYLRANDFDNARAAFNGALYQDSINLDGERGQDFASMNYLAGWSSWCANDLAVAQEQFDFAKKTNADLVAPTTGANLIVVAELGYGPTKVKGGANKELLEFQSNKVATENAVDVAYGVNKTAASLTPVTATSLSYQASERDGRKMDGVLKQKADTRNALNAAGQAMMTNALLQSSNPYGSQGGAMAGMFGGLALSLLSSAVRADADIRQWDSLPEHLLLASAVKPAKLGDIKVGFSADKNPLDLKSAVVAVSEGPRCSMIWTRSRSSLEVPAATPGDDAGVAKASSSRKDVQLKDKAFRESLSVL